MAKKCIKMYRFSCKNICFKILMIVYFVYFRQTSASNFFIAKQYGSGDHVCVTNSSYSMSWIQEEIKSRLIYYPFFIPYSKPNNFDSTISERDATTTPFVRSPWSLVSNSLNSEINEIILDRRWEGLGLYMTEFVDRKNAYLKYQPVFKNLKKDFEIPLSIRLKQEAHIFLCDGNYPPNSNCYWLMLQSWSRKKSAIRKCVAGYIPSQHEKWPNKPCSNILRELNHTNDPNSLYFSNQKWSHLKITKKANTLNIFSVNNNKKEKTILNLEDQKNPIDVTHMIIHSKEFNGLWKIHNLEFIYTNHESSRIHLGNLIYPQDHYVCINFFIAMCTFCTLTLTLEDSGNNVIEEKVYKYTSPGWSEIKFTTENIKQLKSPIKFLVSTSSSNPDRFWAIDDIRICQKKEFRAISLSENAKCQFLSEENNVISISPGAQRLNSSCPENTIGDFCVPCEWVFKNCEKIEVCQKDRCVCSAGYKLYKGYSGDYECYSECDSSYYGHGCLKQCPNCVNFKCNHIDGTCYYQGQCLNQYTGPKCDTRIQVKVSPKEALVLPGRNVTIMCQASVRLQYCRVEIPGMSTLNLIPKLSNPDVAYYGSGLEDGQCKFTVSRVSEKNNGQVRCMLGVLTEEVESTGTVQLIVAKAPRGPEMDLSRGPDSVNIYKINDILQASCVVRDGRPVANISWFLNDDPLYISEVSMPTIIDMAKENLQSKVQNMTRTLQASDNGKLLKCVAYHPAYPNGREETSRQLEVKYGPLPQMIKPKFGYVVGQPGLITVVVEANPRPIIEWDIGNGEKLRERQTDQTGRIEAEEVKDMGKGRYDVSLKIAAIYKEDAKRTYSLRAYNNMGEYEYRIMISTSPEPEVRISKENTTLENFKLVFNCSLNKSLDSFEITIGDNKQPNGCENTKHPPLEPATEYIIAVKFINTFTQKSQSKIFTKLYKTTGKSPAMLHLELLGLLVLLFIPIAVVLYIKRDKIISVKESMCPKNRTSTEVLELNEVQIPLSQNIQPKRKNTKEHDYQNCTLMPSKVETKKFYNYVKTTESCGQLKRQHQIIMETLTPYDIIFDNFQVEYIDVNYINGHQIQKVYIATQRPTEKEINRFWKIVWDENVHYIVLYDLIPKNRHQLTFEKYWPEQNEDMQLNNIFIKCDASKKYQFYTCRTFTVTLNNKNKQVKQLHYSSNNTENLSTIKYVDFFQAISNIPLDTNSPILIHSSYGMSENCFVLLCDMSLRLARRDGVLDVMNTLRKLTEFSPQLIVDYDHYVLAHKTILEGLLYKKTSAECDCLQPNDYIVPISPHEQSYLKYLEKTWWLDSTEGNTRFDQIRRLSTDGFKSGGNFLVIPHPSMGTINNFWQQIEDANISLIISVNGDVSVYLHKEISSIQLSSGIIIKKIDIKHFNTFEWITVEMNNRRNIQIFSMKNWPANTILPGNVSDFVNFCQETNEMLNKHNSIAVTCHDGLTAAGLYITMSYNIQKIKTEGVSDICTCIRLIRSQCQYFFRKKILYKFLMEATHIYENEFGLYEVR